MKIKYITQAFQTAAVESIANIFSGQEKYAPETFRHDSGYSGYNDDENNILEIGYANSRLKLSDEQLLANLNLVRKRNGLPHMKGLAEGGEHVFTVEMETGVGKTYTYLKTIFELNRRYGWQKFIIVVPSIAIREGVSDAISSTKEHFDSVFPNQSLLSFVYNSSRLHEVDYFATSNDLQVMIINMSAFNKGTNSFNKTHPEKLRGRSPMGIIKKLNPIVIIDEPQSVEGEKTQGFLSEFNALFTLRYSATPKNYFNLVYRLDARRAFREKLVKKIEVVGLEESSNYVDDYTVQLNSVERKSSNVLEAKVTAYKRVKTGIVRSEISLKNKDDLYSAQKSNGIEAYKDGYTVDEIGFDENGGYIEFSNHIKLYCGYSTESDRIPEIRRIQIRETIKAHLCKEQMLFKLGVKVLSLFFIDRVANYIDGNSRTGKYALMFQDEYEQAVKELLDNHPDDEYAQYLKSIPAQETHNGYFCEKGGKATDINITDNEKESKTTDELIEKAFDQIMGDKRRLLDMNDKVRFIFSHSALKEGWDNPNVFQVCSLKPFGKSETRRRQEIGRGMRLCVDKNGIRQDSNTVGESHVHDINVLTVIANQSYNDYAKGLQQEYADIMTEDLRPRKVSEGAFIGLRYVNKDGETCEIDSKIDAEIRQEMFMRGYTDFNGEVQESYHSSRDDGTFEIDDKFATMLDIITAVYDNTFSSMQNPENGADKNIVTATFKKERASEEFMQLWAMICKKSVFELSFKEDMYIDRAIQELNELKQRRVYIMVQQGILGIDMDTTKEQLQAGEAMQAVSTREVEVDIPYSNLRFDLVSRVTTDTMLKRSTVVAILKGINEEVFDIFRHTPEEFAIVVVNILNRIKQEVINDQIEYYPVDNSQFDFSIFENFTKTGDIKSNARKSDKHLYDYVVYDSNTERIFSEELDKHDTVVSYVKLPDGPHGFYIDTPVGKYNPDWAVAFREGSYVHIYFVVETKGTTDTSERRPVENFKIRCAKKHFEAICGNKVEYMDASNFKQVLDKLKSTK